jgi:mannose-6-phosphate isomerase-like protein (cupin superfamily)
MTQIAPARPYVRRDEEGDSLWFFGSLLTVKTAGQQTGGRLSVVEFLNPPGFGPPLHRHTVEDEAFYVLSGTAHVLCGDEEFDAGPGDFVLLPLGLPHTFLVGPDEPLRSLVITAPAGFERFVAAAGEPAPERQLPDPGPIDPAAVAQLAARYGIETLGPPPHS